tara:strand:- start:82 stop:336 length:255 start_codon:yes stop_codon:yes gene_type:complete
MARHKMENGIKVMFTAEEEAFRDAEEAQELANRPMEKWKEAIQATDSSMPRYAEDILDGMDKSGVAQILLDRLQSKKELRATKP